MRIDPPLPRDVQAALARRIRAAHCGHANDKMTAVMIRAQRLKDAWMAWRLVTAAKDGGKGVLIAGAAHVRRDWAVPVYIRRHDVPPSATRTVAFTEVHRGASTPELYDTRPFDYVVFTPAVDDRDPCEKFRRHLEKLRHH